MAMPGWSAGIAVKEAANFRRVVVTAVMPVTIRLLEPLEPTDDRKARATGACNRLRPSSWRRRNIGTAK
jgi:hypothetical protein